MDGLLGAGNLLDFAQLAAFFLVLLRATAFVVSGPLFALRGIPVPVKAGFAFLLALALYPVLPVQDYLPGDFLLYLLQAAGEVAVGFGLGLLASLVLQIVQMAGHLLDIQIGFSLANIFDPVSGAQNTLIGHFMYLCGLLLFLNLDGHHHMLLALAKSYQLVPLTSASVTGEATEVAMKAFAGAFAIAVQVAAPILAVLVITDLAFGFVARTAPQINVFMLGFALRIAIGLLIISLLAPVFVSIFSVILRFVENNLFLLMRGLS